MKANIHPKYESVVASCSCGHHFETRSTAGKNLKLEVCSNCHPYYTGQKKVVDTEGRVETFKRRFAQFGKSKKS